MSGLSVTLLTLELLCMAWAMVFCSWWCRGCVYLRVAYLADDRTLPCVCVLANGLQSVQ